MATLFGNNPNAPRLHCQCGKTRSCSHSLNSSSLELPFRVTWEPCTAPPTHSPGFLLGHLRHSCSPHALIRSNCCSTTVLNPLLSLLLAPPTPLSLGVVVPFGTAALGHQTTSGCSIIARRPRGPEEAPRMLSPDQGLSLFWW